MSRGSRLGAPSVRRFQAHEWPTYRDLRLRAPVDSPDAFGSTLAVEKDRADAEWARRLEAGMDDRSQLPLIAEMWVDPACRRRGAARLLMETIVAWARSNGVQTLALDVTCDNVAATRLYREMGFLPVGDPEPLRPGSPLLRQGMRLALSRVG